jgi:hypothetical protein
VDDILVILLLLPFNYLLPWWIVRRDMRSLPAERLEKCWNGASLGAAILAFGPLCLPFHFVKAHGLVRGLVLGLAWTAGAVFLPALGLEALGTLLHTP